MHITHIHLISDKNYKLYRGAGHNVINTTKQGHRPRFVKYVVTKLSYVTVLYNNIILRDCRDIGQWTVKVFPWHTKFKLQCSLPCII